MQKIKVAIVGTHGVPAKYGGFETLADFLCQHLGEDISFTVYCNSNKYIDKPKFYHNARLKYLKLDASGFQGVLYDFITYIHALFTSKIVLYLSPVGSGIIIPLKYITAKKVIVNHGGFNEWERPKLSKFQKKWAKFNHLVASKFADINIADNNEYQQSLKENFGANSIVVRYGADHAKKTLRSDPRFMSKYEFLPSKYAVSVSRAQIDNNLHLVLSAFKIFKNYPLVLVSNWDVSEYGKALKEEFSNCSNIFMIDAIYENDELDYIRGNAYVYIHSHSFCGTAPSLVEAMYLGKPIISFDVPTNRETTKDKALFFHSSDDLVAVLKDFTDEDVIVNGKLMLSIAEEEYTWKKISSMYLDLLKEKL